MPWIPTIQLAELTGSTVRTVKKRCDGLERRKGPKGAILFDSKQALPLIYQLDEDDKPDPTKENALLSRERRKKTCVERMVLEGGLVPASEVVGFCYDANVTTKDKILSIVPRLRNKYPHVDSETMSDIDDELRAILTELADDGIPNSLRSKMSIYLSGVSAAAESDDQPVG